jgi:hypothetical protein
MTGRSQSIRRVRRQRRQHMQGFIVTWDVDSSDAASCARVRRFVFGYDLRKNGRAYHYPGVVESGGVRYLGQSVLFVTADVLAVLRRFLVTNGIEHAVMDARIGRIVPI